METEQPRTSRKCHFLQFELGADIQSEATYPREFRVNATKSVMIPMMHEDSKFAFGILGNLKATAVLVPFPMEISECS